METTATRVRQCWICFGEEPEAAAEDGNAEADRWVRPCRCRGSTQWVHQSCLLNWINLKLQTLSSFSSSAGSTTASSSSPASFDGPLITPRIKCPQCHTEYRFIEAHLLPKRLLAAIEGLTRIKDRALMFASLAAVAGSLYVVGWAYGAGTIAVCVGKSGTKELVDRFVMPLWNLAATLKSNSGPPLGMCVVKVFVGVPLIPLYILSTQYTSLSWLYPLIPALLYTGPNSRPLFSWPPSSTGLVLSLPFLHSAYSFFVLPFLARLRRSFDAKDEGVVLDYNLVSPAGRTASATTTSERISFGPSTESSDEEEDFFSDERSIRISILSTITTLLFPAAAATTGYLLFGNRTRLAGFSRTFAGGLFLMVAKDVVQLLYRFQSDRVRRSRRVLNYK